MRCLHPVHRTTHRTKKKKEEKKKEWEFQKKKRGKKRKSWRFKKKKTAMYCWEKESPSSLLPKLTTHGLAHRPFFFFFFPPVRYAPGIAWPAQHTVFFWSRRFAAFLKRKTKVASAVTPNVPHHTNKKKKTVRVLQREGDRLVHAYFPLSARQDDRRQAT